MFNERLNVTPKIGWEKYLWLILLETVPWTHDVKDFHGETIIGSFYEKEFLLSKLKMSYYPEPSSYIGDKVITFATLCY